MDTIKIGLRIKHQRQLLDYTREELAEKVNIIVSTFIAAVKES